MPIQTGTHTIADLASRQFATELVMPNNVDAMNEAVTRDLEAHNARVDEMVRQFADVSTERSTVYGTSAETEMHKKDEFTRGPTQKIRRGGKVEFPLEAFQHAVGWSADFLRRATVQDMALKTIAARRAHVRRIEQDLKEAWFGPTNYTSVDRWDDGNSLAVKRLVNADGATIPGGPNGESFDGATHTHYDAVDFTAATADAKAAALAALVSDVVEHGHSAGLTIYINQANESEVRAATDFVGLVYPNTLPAPGGTADRGVGVVDIAQPNNRLVGYHRGVPVWAKPWVPVDYALATALGEADAKPLRMRISSIASEQGLYLAGDIATFPLQAEYMEARHGFGALTRTNGAVLFLGSSTYTAPTF